MIKQGLIAGVDIGSSSIKWAVYNFTTKKLLKSGNIRYPNGTFEKDNIDVNVISNKFLELLGTLNDYGVSYVGMSTMAPVLVCINSNKFPLTGIPYNSLQGSEFLGDLDYEYIRDVTLNVPNVQFFYQKIKWIKLNSKNILSSTRWIVDLNGFLFSKLDKETEMPVQDVNTAFEWGMINHNTLSWDDTIVEKLSIKDKLPRLVSPEYSIKYKNMVVSIGTVDTIVAALGSVGLDYNKFFVSNGSTLCAGFVSPNPLNVKTLYNDIYFDGKYLINGCNSQYSTILDWAERNFQERIDVNRIDMNPRSVTFLPYLEGERCPIFNTKIRAGFYGIDKWTTNNDMIASVVHSLAYLTTDMIDNLIKYGEGEQQFNEIIAGGGMSKRNIGSIVAALTNLKYEIAGMEPTTLGAAFIAMKSNGLIDSYPGTKTSTLKIDFKIEPNTSVLTHKRSYQQFKMFRDSALRIIREMDKLSGTSD